MQEHILNVRKHWLIQNISLFKETFELFRKKSHDPLFFFFKKSS